MEESRGDARMRFGIQVLDWPIVLDQLMAKGTIDVSRFDFAELIRIANDRGFSLMELTGDISYILPGALTEKAVTDLLTIKNEFDITYTIHLPLWSLEPSSPNSFIRKASVECLVDIANRVKPLEPEIYVLHPTGSLASEFTELNIPPTYRSLVVEMTNSLAEQSIREFLQQTEIAPRKIALESIEYPFELTWRTAERLDTSVCLDTGHLLSGQSGPISILEFIDRYYDRIGEIHLHDGAIRPQKGNRFQYFDHQELGSGDLPIKEFFTKLSERGYDGPIIFELTMQGAEKSLRVIRKLLPDLPID